MLILNISEVSDLKDEKIICNCRNINVGKIKKAIADGAKNFEDVQNMTGVSKSCGRCIDHAKAVVEELLSPNS